MLSIRSGGVVCFVAGATLLLAGCPPSALSAASSLQEFRRIDETFNNLEHPDWGTPGSLLLRLANPEYADGVSAPAGSDRPSARLLSDIVVRQDKSIPNARGVDDMFWQWGQFLDHDLSVVPTTSPALRFDIPVPLGDNEFDPFGAGGYTIELDRSVHVLADGVAEQPNKLTSYIDASQVYGSDTTRAMTLRALDGTGHLKLDANRLLPLNDTGLPNAPTADDPTLFLAGDVRANEQTGLTVMHVVFAREHNYWADALRAVYPNWSDDQLYFTARAIVGAEMQVVTFQEFLPVLLGPNAIPAYQGYDANVNPGISNEFTTAAFRVGHTMLSPNLLRLNSALQTIPQGPLALRDSFFNPDMVRNFGVEPYIRGLCAQYAQEVDSYVIDDVRNFLFGPPGAGGFDLASLNIQRGRDHGLASYNDTRQQLGLARAATFSDISSDPDVSARLASAYASVDDVDLWLGGIAEDHVQGAMVGETFWVIIRDQFLRLRDGDRFWYQRYLPTALVQMVEQQTLAGILHRNCDIGTETTEHAAMLVPPSPAS